jgi:hypothetical protein
MNQRLIITLKKLIASYSIPQIQRMAQGIINQFFPEVEMPDIRIVNHTFPTYVGITRFRQKNDYEPTIVVELQKSILDDERTLHRTLAHELIHVWQYSNADIRKKLLSGTKSEDHGKSFNLMADKMNAVYGENYITKTSDATDVITQEKEFYILIQPHKETNQSKANKFGVTKFTRPSKAQKAEIQKRLLEQGGHVFKTKEKLFSRSADLKPFGGYSIYKDEVQNRLSEIYSGPNQDKLFLDKAAVTSDFKTTEKKFLDRGVAKDEVKKYLDAFKKLRDANRIHDVQEKNIDFWGTTQSFDEFKSFVDALSEEKSKTETKKLKKMEAAELIAENEDWYVYEITTHEACMLYGSGTKWCITQPDGEHWNEYSSQNNIYFLLSKKLNKDDKFYKIAVTVDSVGGELCWDALDEDCDSDVESLNIPNVKFEPIDLNSKPEEFQLETIKKDARAIQNIKNPSEKVQLEAVKKLGSTALQYINNPTEKLQLEAIKRHFTAIRFIENPSEELQREAARQNGNALKYIQNPSEKVQLEAVKQNGYTIRYIKNPSEKVQLEAVKQDSSFVTLIENPTDKVKKYVKNGATSSLMKVLATLIHADFKTAKKKFLDANIPVTTIDEVLKRFKKLRDQHRIEKDNEKNIDYWSTKQFEELVDFVTDLESTPSKTKLRKAPWKMATPDGATKVAENDSWVVYKINDFEASEKLGTRNWCISRDVGHYQSETAGMTFYFLLSKTRSYDEESKEEKSGHIFYKDDWHRIALQVTHAGKKTFWDANDDSHMNVPDEVISSVPSFIIEKPEVVYSLHIDDYGEPVDLYAKNLEDAIEEAERNIQDMYSDSDYRRKTSTTQRYYIYVGSESVHRGTVEIEGEWASLRKGIRGSIIVGVDNNDFSDASILEFNSTYYFSSGESEDDYIDEIDEDDAKLFLLQWGELNAITRTHEDKTMYLFDTWFYLNDQNDIYAYKDMLHDLDSEDSTPEALVKPISTEEALEYLFNWEEFNIVYFNPDQGEALFQITFDGGFYQVEYEGDRIPQDTIKITDFTKLTEKEFEKLSTEEGLVERK